MGISSLAIRACEHGKLPDAIIRLGIRRLCQKRLAQIQSDHCELAAELGHIFVEGMHAAPIALVPELANQQHYEVPADFYDWCLGKHKKYSACFWNHQTSTLDEAEALALAQTCAHARIQNGQRILELGCGWGSLTLWIAEHYPQSHIVAVSNSASQKAYILAQAAQRGLQNLEVLTCDMNHFQPASFGIHTGFDRVVSVEMFEHMRNYALLYRQIHAWLVPGGLFFKHIFVHRFTPYVFDTVDEDDWMGRYFFSGGIMPSDDLPLRFQEHLTLIRQWRWDGTHYEKTANAWLENMDKHYDQITPVLAKIYGASEVELWRNRWRIFFMACAELFGYNNGQEWWVSHYLFERQA